MLLPVFHDLIRPKWRLLLEELKASGAMAVGDLAARTNGSYMTVKTQCEQLVKAGYLIRTRLPRTGIGRPIILYSLASKADGLFPETGTGFTLELLDEARQMFGENAPEKLLFQYFQNRGEALAKALTPQATLEKRMTKLAILRTRAGCVSRFSSSPDGLRITELHNPLQRIFEVYPRAVTMELRMIERVLGNPVDRSEIPTGRQTPPHVVFHIP